MRGDDTAIFFSPRFLPSTSMSTFGSRLASSKNWVEPASLPKYGDASEIRGNASDLVKQLTSNTLGAYGVGDVNCFAYHVGRDIKITEVNVDKRGEKLEAEVIEEVVVSQREFSPPFYVCLPFLLDPVPVPSNVLIQLMSIPSFGTERWSIPILTSSTVSRTPPTSPTFTPKSMPRRKSCRPGGRFALSTRPHSISLTSGQLLPCAI